MADLRATLDPKDYKYIVEKPDPNYSPEKNRAVVQETIKETEKFFKDMYKPLMDEEGKRIDILAHYGVYKLGLGKGKTLKQYLGKRQYEALIGEKILKKIRVMDTVNRLNKNDKYKKFIQL